MELIWLAHSLLQFEGPLHYEMTQNLYIHNPNGEKCLPTPAVPSDLIYQTSHLDLGS